MPLFKRRASSESAFVGLPHNAPSLMERFGRFEFDPQASTDDASAIWAETQRPFMDYASKDPQGFLDALVTEVLPAGGWACYGAAHTVWNCMSAPVADSVSYLAIVDACIDFLRHSGVPPSRVNGNEWNRWIERGGTADTWIPRRPTPNPEEAPIRALEGGELRRIAQLVSASDSNVIFVHLRHDGQYEALIDAKWSDDDPRRVQSA